MQKNNFHFLRFLFASLVIISHSYPLTGLDDCDWLCQVSTGQLNFSFIGVKGFFVISGYLILTSLLASKNLLDYLWKRVLRLYPALFVVLVVTLPIVSLTMAPNEFLNFWKQTNTYMYIIRNLTLYNLQYGISGIFENIPYPSAINGSLWTIPYEFQCYLLLTPVLFIRKHLRTVTFIVVTTYLSLLAIRLSGFIPTGFTFGLSDEMLWDLGTYFMGGAALKVISFEDWSHRTTIIVLSLFILFFAAITGHFSLVKYVFFPPLVIAIGISSYCMISDMHKHVGDISYGIYIYSFPIQQLIVFYLATDHITLMVLSWLTVLPIAYLSWNLVEKKALTYKHLVRDKISPSLGSII